MSKRIFTPEQIQEMIDYYLAPHTLVETEKFFKYDHRLLKKLLLANGVQLHSKEFLRKSANEKLSELAIQGRGQEIIDFYLAPNLGKDTCKKFNICQEALTRLLEKNNIPKHSNETVNQLRSIQFTFEQEQEIINYYLIPKSQNQTAIHFNINRMLLKRILKKYNIPLHSDKLIRQLQAQEAEKTNWERYGYKSPVQTKEVQDKIKATNLERYGVENVSQAEIIKEKKKQVFQEHYGVDYNFQAKEIKNKIEQTMWSRYGKKSYTQTEDYILKTKQTNLEKYGYEYASQSPEGKEKRRRSCQAEYGTDYYFQTKEFKEILKQRYGVYHCSRKRYKYNNETFDSFPELCFYVYNIVNNKKIIREPCKLVFIFEDKECNYIPDFQVDDQLIEIKGPQFIKEDGSWWNPYGHHLDNLFEAKHQCAIKNNVKILTESEYLFYENWFKQNFNEEEYRIN